jgi:hypothetical protein
VKGVHVARANDGGCRAALLTTLTWAARTGSVNNVHLTTTHLEGTTCPPMGMRSSLRTSQCHSLPPREHMAGESVVV